MLQRSQYGTCRAGGALRFWPDVSPTEAIGPHVGVVDGIENPHTWRGLRGYRRGDFSARYATLRPAMYLVLNRAIYPVKKILNGIWQILSERRRSDSLSYAHPLLT